MRTGFSLVELLVVMGIFALLAVLAVPAVQNAWSRAKDAELASNLRQVGVALLAYAGENNNQFPMAYSDVPYQNSPEAEDPVAWQQALDEYVRKDRRVFLFSNTPEANSRILPVRGVRGFFLGSRAAFLDAGEEFNRVQLSRIQNPSAYILGGEVRFGPFSETDADRDNYSMDPAFNGRTEPGQPANLLFADGSVRRYAFFDQTEITTHYDGPGLEEPEW